MERQTYRSTRSRQRYTACSKTSCLDSSSRMYTAELAAVDGLQQLSSSSDVCHMRVSCREWVILRPGSNRLLQRDVCPYYIMNRSGTQIPAGHASVAGPENRNHDGSHRKPGTRTMNLTRTAAGCKSSQSCCQPWMRFFYAARTMCQLSWRETIGHRSARGSVSLSFRGCMLREPGKNEHVPLAPSDCMLRRADSCATNSGTALSTARREARPVMTTETARDHRS